MKCNFCGREWKIETPDVMFCPFCGVPLSISPEMSFESEKTEKKTPPRLQVERKRYEEGDRDEWGIYTGEVVGENRDGYGVMEFYDGARYEGEWKEDKYNGKGKFTGVDEALVGVFLLGRRGAFRVVCHHLPPLIALVVSLSKKCFLTTENPAVSPTL